MFHSLMVKHDQYYSYNRLWNFGLLSYNNCVFLIFIPELQKPLHHAEPEDHVSVSVAACVCVWQKERKRQDVLFDQIIWVGLWEKLETDCGSWPTVWTYFLTVFQAYRKIGFSTESIEQQYNEDCVFYLYALSLYRELDIIL